MSAARSEPFVLVADDDPALRLLCRINLEHDGYRVGEAASAAEVARALAEEDVALVLLDVHLGSDDGIAVARALRADGSPTRVALFSGSASELTAEQRSLVDAVLPKPFSLDSLIATVRSLASP